MIMEDNTDSGTGANAVSDIGTPTYTSGKIGNALTLDGSTDALNVDALATDVASDTTGSISAWINPDGTAGGQCWFALADSATANQIYFTWDNTPKVVFTCEVTGGGGVRWQHNTPVSSGTWTHIVAVQDGVALKVYINGSLVTLTDTVTTATGEWLNDLTVSANAGTIGARRAEGSTSQYFDGQIDDLRYFKCVLSQAEVTALYNGGSGTENSIITDASSHDDLPFAHMIMDDSTDTGTGANAVTDIGTPTYTAGHIGNSLTLDGSTDALNLDALQTDIASDTVGSISMWVSMNTADRDFFTVGDTSADSYFLFTTNGSNVIQLNGTVAGTTQFSVRADDFGALATDGTWYHLVVVQDGTGIKAYVNGALQNLFYVNATDLTAWFADAPLLDNARLGCRSITGSGNSQFLDGQIDDFRYYRLALTPTQVTNLYNGGSGTETAATSGGNNPLVQTFGDAQIQESAGGLQTVPDSESFGGYARFNGTSSHFVVDAHTDFDLGSSDFTIDAWIRMDPITTYNTIIMQGDDSTHQWAFRVDIGGELHFSAYKADGSLSGNFVTTSPAITDTKWHHVATRRSGSTQTMWLDGVSVPVTVSTAWNGTVGSWSGLVSVGFNQVGASYYFPGDMDDVRVSTTARTNGGYATTPASTDASTRLLLQFDKDIIPEPYTEYRMGETAAATTVNDTGTGSNNATSSVNTSVLTGNSPNELTQISPGFGFNVPTGTGEYLNIDALETAIQNTRLGIVQFEQIGQQQGTHF